MGGARCGRAGRRKRGRSVGGARASSSTLLGDSFFSGSTLRAVVVAGGCGKRQGGFGGEHTTHHRAAPGAAEGGKGLLVAGSWQPASQPPPAPASQLPMVPDECLLPRCGGVCPAYRRVPWLLGGSLVSPCDPQAQTPFLSPPGARRMDFFDGPRAPCGVRRALVCARGGSQQGADLPCTRLAESRSAVWQVLGHSQGCFVMVPNTAKGARRQQKKGGLSTRGGG